jgi:dihydrofolate synthase/folylpolyglutamate synthase
MGDPQRACPAVVVAGTNGKGSVATALAHLLRHAGLRVGLYTSPHFLCLHERIRVDGERIDEAELFALVSEFRGQIEAAGTTFFETLTALAFEHFRRKECDVLVLEAGLGGRLDATRVARKTGVILTSIGLDHQELLGRTREAIAQEKLGLMERGVPLYLLSTEQPLRRLAHLRARELGCEVTEVETSAVAVPPSLRSPRLRSSYRRVAQVAQDVCRRCDWAAPDAEAAAEHYQLTGRYDLRGHRPPLLLDSAHNAHALRPLLREWGGQDGPRDRAVLVLGATEGKDLAGVALAAVESAGTILCVRPHWPRAMSPQALARHIVEDAAGCALPYDLRVMDSVREGLELARERARVEGGRVLVCGSNFLVAEALDRLGVDSIDTVGSPLWDEGLPLRRRSPAAIATPDAGPGPVT